MKRTRLTALGETEMEVLEHVWALRTATVAAVHERILATRDVAYTTVMTVMKNLADKGYLAYEREGQAYVYTPVRPADEVRHGLLAGLMKKVFGGSPEALVQSLVRHEPLSADERAALRRLLDELDEADNG